MKITDNIVNKIRNNKYALPILQGVGVIALITAISVISVHFLTGDTISDYAEANPELAYAPEPIPETELIGDNPQQTDESNNVPEDMGTSAGGAVAGETEDTEISTDQVNDSAAEDAPEQQAADDSGAEETELPSYNRSVMIRFYDPDSDCTGRTEYQPGFYYEPLTEEVREYITGISYPDTEEDIAVSYDDLRYLGLLYVDFNGLTQAGELICNEKIAGDLAEIFYELYISDYRIDSIYLIDNFGGDDTASMSADNTSCFNYRVVEGSTSLSKHAYGLAIDINPFYNPYIVFGAGEGGGDYISPAGSEIYADRSKNFAYKIDENDLCYKLFKEHGFTWGGNWNSCKDYQHFQKAPN